MPHDFARLPIKSGSMNHPLRSHTLHIDILSPHLVDIKYILERFFPFLEVNISFNVSLDVSSELLCISPLQYLQRWSSWFFLTQPGNPSRLIPKGRKTLDLYMSRLGFRLVYLRYPQFVRLIDVDMGAGPATSGAAGEVRSYEHLLDHRPWYKNRRTFVCHIRNQETF